MRRLILLLAIVLFAAALVAQDETGLSPKAGAFSADLYTNVYFGFNLKVPPKWNVTWVAETGPCGNQCMLLDVRDPDYDKDKQLMQVTAEDIKGHSPVRESAEGAFLVQAGAKKLGDAREVTAGGVTFYRTDYRSSLADSTLYQTMLVLPGKDYAAVFTFSSINRRDVDDIVAGFPTMFSKTGPQ
jgi:hypothetical protein